MGDLELTNKEKEGVAPQKESSSIVDWLKRQKEVITLILFFLGGLYFIQVTYATHKQVRVLECELENKTEIAAIDLEMKEKDALVDRLLDQQTILLLAKTNLSSHEEEILENTTMYVKKLRLEVQQKREERKAFEAAKDKCEATN